MVKRYCSHEQVVPELRGINCHGITQCYFPPDTGEHAPPNPSRTVVLD